MNSDTRRGRRAGVLAALVVTALLTAACGGSTSTGAGGSSSTGGSSLPQEELAVAQCMRSHGVPAFPDPSANGGYLASSVRKPGREQQRLPGGPARLPAPGPERTPLREPPEQQVLSQVLSSPSACARTACRTSPTPTALACEFPPA